VGAEYHKPFFAIRPGGSRNKNIAPYKSKIVASSGHLLLLELWGSTCNAGNKG
jgi:hypothetical protein